MENIGFPFSIFRFLSLRLCGENFPFSCHKTTFPFLKMTKALLFRTLFYRNVFVNVFKFGVAVFDNGRHQIVFVHGLNFEQN